MAPCVAVIISATQGADTHIDLGLRAYVDIDGATVALDADSIYNGIDAALSITDVRISLALGAYGTLADVSGVCYLNNREPVTMYMTALDEGGTYDGGVADTIGWVFVYVTE